MNSYPMTLTRFIIQRQAAHPGATGEFSSLMTQIGVVGKLIARDLRRAGLLDIVGVTGETNVQGEATKKLDQIANETFVRVFQNSGLVSAMVSEEMEKPLHLRENWPQAKYALVFDPMDGSSNTDVNMPLGSIFSILKHEEKSGMPEESSLVRRGTEQVAAGYIMYGSSTILVYTAGAGVHAFTLDAEVGEFLLSRENITMPARGKVYAANEGNLYKWSPSVRRFVEHLRSKEQGYSTRYSGCLAADVHRLLVTGGIYLYPAETGKAEGKLRLLYEANPLALIVERAGGRASTGTQRVLDLEPVSLHQRVPLYIGSREDVELAQRFIMEGGS